MKRLVSQLLATFAAVAFGIVAFSAAALAPATAQTPAPNFGNPRRLVKSRSCTTTSTSIRNPTA